MWTTQALSSGSENLRKNTSVFLFYRRHYNQHFLFAWKPHFWTLWTVGLSLWHQAVFEGSTDQKRNCFRLAFLPSFSINRGEKSLHQYYIQRQDSRCWDNLLVIIVPFNKTSLHKGWFKYLKWHVLHREEWQNISLNLPKTSHLNKINSGPLNSDGSLTSFYPTW